MYAKDFREERKKHTGYITVGPFRLSVQGSDFHYCLPRKNCDIYEYTHLEVAILTERQHTSFKQCESYPWIDTDPRFKGPWLEYLQKAERTWIMAYVPVDVIQDLYERLIEISKQEV